MNLVKPFLGFTGAIGLVLAALFAAEGGYVNHPSDPGGETNHGITKRTAEGQGYHGPMKALTKEKAAEIYVREYILGPGFLPYLERSVHLGEELVDTGANAGPPREARWLQESLNHLNSQGRDYPDVAEDGRLGPGTLAAYDALRRKRGDKLACELVIKLVDAKQAQHYMRLAAKNPKFEDFMVGWVRARIGNVDFRRCGPVPNLTPSLPAAPPFVPADNGPWRPGS